MHTYALIALLYLPKICKRLRALWVKGAKMAFYILAPARHLFACGHFRYKTTYVYTHNHINI